jgi:hypothetical protein
MNGQVTLNGNTISNTAVSIAYSIDNGGSWRDLTMVTTESDGTYSVDWRPDVSGYYLIRATCDETLAMNSASKTVSLALTRDEEQHSVFTVNSNSTITQFAFDSTSGKLSFVATARRVQWIRRDLHPQVQTKRHLKAKRHHRRT